MNLRKIASGHYQSEDGRVEIKREEGDVFNGRRYVNETVWTASVDGKVLMSQARMKDAVDVAKRRLNKGI